MSSPSSEVTIQCDLRYKFGTFVVLCGKHAYLGLMPPMADLGKDPSHGIPLCLEEMFAL